MFFKSLDSDVPLTDWWEDAWLYRSANGDRELLVRGRLAEVILAVVGAAPDERTTLTIEIEGDPQPLAWSECLVLVERSDFPILV